MTTIEHAQTGLIEPPPRIAATRAERAHELVAAVQELSLARTVAEIQEIVRGAARRLTGADGATFVLRRDPYCYYADEDAISPLWKGQQFPQDICISGWVMSHRRPVVIEDIYEDDRIPHDAYRPTFVKSLAMVPIRPQDPVGAIGNYWATRHRPTDEELELLQALADSTAVAMENVRVYQELEQRVADRTAQLEARTRELEETNDSIRALYDEVTAQAQRHLEVLNALAHEVRTPLAAGRGLIDLALASGDGAAAASLRSDLEDVRASIAEAIDVVSRQLDSARLEEGTVHVRSEDVDVGAELARLSAMFRALTRSERVVLRVEPPAQPLVVCTDRALLGHALRNLLGNALKFTDEGEVCLSAAPDSGGGVRFQIADTGIGIARDDIPAIFEEWGQVSSAQPQRPAGSGLGLPLVGRIADALGGRIDVESEVGRGSRFTIVLPAEPPSPS